jgi:YegS/Rv2252/BmrU family lipid kinase
LIAEDLVAAPANASGGAESPPRLLVIANPFAGSRPAARTQAALAGMLRRLKAGGCEIELRQTGRRGDAEQFAHHAALQASSGAAPWDVLAVAGGDGTINEVVNGLAAGGHGWPLPLAVLPFGTANVLAAEIGVASRDDAVTAILRGCARSAHVGIANGRCFTMMAGVGFDAHVVRGIAPAVKRRLGKSAYGLEMLRQLVRYPFARYGVTIDGVSYDAASVVVAKGRYYGGRFVCAPAACLGDPGFQVCLFESSGRRAAVTYALALGTGGLAHRADYRILPATSVRIEGPADDPVQGDGEVLTKLPVEIALASQPLRLWMPAPQQPL